MSIYGLFKVLSFNVPFVFLALEFLIGKEFVPCLVGLVVGHLHYYLQVCGMGWYTPRWAGQKAGIGSWSVWHGLAGMRVGELQGQGQRQ